MPHDRWARSAAIVWFVVGSLFAVVLVAHNNARKFSFKHIEVSDRATTSLRPGPNDALITMTPDGAQIAAPLSIESADVDKPLKDFANDFNKYIDSVNEKSRDESRWLVLLDIIGTLSAYFSAIYEFIKIKPTPISASSIGKPKSITTATENMTTISPRDIIKAPQSTLWLRRNWRTRLLRARLRSVVIAARFLMNRRWLGRRSKKAQ